MPDSPGHDARVHVLGLDRSALREMLAAQGEPPFRADQLLEWIYAKDAQSFDVMSNLPKRLREQLALTATIGRARLAAQSVAADATHKLLFTWPDGRAVESVWIPEDGRHTVCISSQVGCPVGCRFCASGIDGVERDLAAGEIVEQVWHVRRIVARDGPTAPDGEPARLSNVVFMGMGEPLANYDNVVKAIRIINADWGLGLGARKITLSTVGLPKQIRRLADEGLQINLALSLHAPDEALRQELIPWGKVPIADLIDACRYFFDKTGREVTLEYVLLAGVNMTRQHATRLAIICRKLRCNVNLLRYNPVAGLPFERPSAAEAAAFQQALRGQGVNAHIRRSRGSDVDAACGQLRRRLQPTDADLGLPSRDAPI